MKCGKILSPMTGEAVGLGEVPDPVFSQKIIGDGMAVIPSEGKLLSPVDGEVISVATQSMRLAAYGRRPGAFDPCGFGDGTFKGGMLSGLCKTRR